MEQEKQAEESRPDAPGIGEIAEDIKELGARIKELLVSAAQSERAQQLQQQVLAGFDALMDKANQIIEDAKTGQLEQDAKKSLHHSLQKVNKKLNEYSDSITKPEPDQETNETEEQ